MQPKSLAPSRSRSRRQSFKSFQPRARRKFTGRSVNELLNRPSPPGPWVDGIECVCGSKYRNFRAGVDFSEAASAVRIHNGGYENGGGYRSRRVVLWMMHCNKLSVWYTEHFMCGQLEPGPPPEDHESACEHICPWCTHACTQYQPAVDLVAAK